MIGAIGSLGSGQAAHVDSIRTGFKEISSGKKTASTTSPALLEIGRRLLNGSTFAEARNRNITNEISKSQTESSFVQSSQNTLSRISELAVQANSGILNSSDKKALEIEAQELSESLSFDREHAKFNGKQIMNDDEFTAVTESLQNIDFSSSEGISAVADAATAGIDTLSSRQASIGAEQNTLEQRHAANLEEAANLLDAGSRIISTDMAAAFTQLTSDMVMSDVSSAVSSQGASLESSRVEALLR
jgi:flagellin